MALSRHDINRERTIRSIEDAFLAEYSVKGIEGISIIGLCKNSGVSRSTFYLYFDDKYAVLESIEKRLLDGFYKINQNMPYITDSEAPNTHPQEVLDFLFENEKWFKALLGPHGDSGFQYRWKKIILKTLHDRLEEQNIDRVNIDIQGAIFSSGLIGLFTHILFNKPDVSIDHLAQYMTKLLCYTMKL